MGTYMVPFLPSPPVTGPNPEDKKMSGGFDVENSFTGDGQPDAVVDSEQQQVWKSENDLLIAGVELAEPTRSTFSAPAPTSEGPRQTPAESGGNALDFRTKLGVEVVEKDVEQTMENADKPDQTHPAPKKAKHK